MANWDNVHRFLTKWVVPFGSGVVVLAAVFAAIAYIVRAEVTVQLVSVKTDVATLQSDIGGLRGDVANLRADIVKANDRIDGVLSRALERAFPGPTSSKSGLRSSLNQVDALLRIAKAENVKLNPTLLVAYGKRLAILSSESPTSGPAWQTLTAMADYRSFLNADFVPTLGQLTPATGASKYRSVVTILPNPEHPEFHVPFEVFFAGGYATPDKSARLEALNKPQAEGSEFALFVVEGKGTDTILLDGSYMKNVIIRHNDVAYEGGPVVLENVYFVDCTFKHFQMTPSGRELGTKLVAAASVSFESRKMTTAGL